MEDKQFKREDYIYLRILEDFEIDLGSGCIDTYTRGEIIRYRKNFLINELTSGRLVRVFHQDGDGLKYIKNATCDENEVFYDKVYKLVTVEKDINYEMTLLSKDFIYINEWLRSHIDQNSLNNLLKGSKKVGNMVEIGNDNVDIYISFKKGEIIDFSDPAVIMLFYNMNLLKIIRNSQFIVGEEKEQLFYEDFSNAIYAQDEIDSIVFKDNPNFDLKEWHYFIVNEGADTSDLNWNMKLYEVNSKNSKIKVISIMTYDFDNPSRELEQEALKISRRATKEEAIEFHQQILQQYKEESEKRSKELEEQLKKEADKLSEAYDKNKDNLKYFPGTNGKFIQLDESVKLEKHSLEEIREFFIRLKELNERLTREFCFYGGTLPYILTNQDTSRNFGDIDIFVPAPLMTYIRNELYKTSTFELISDSKPLAIKAKLTTKIKCGKDEQESQRTFFNAIANAYRNSDLDEEERKNIIEEPIEDSKIIRMNPSILRADPNFLIDSLYGNGRDINGFTGENYFLPSLSRGFYKQYQDFGFKAKLFGVNISIFPMYQYKSGIMAKSFNISSLFEFLLGVNILRNTKINDFVKSIQILGTECKMLPIEYTLVSKDSAVKNEYRKRLSKDQIDIEFILEHQKELGIDESLMARIRENYPDFSISVAYNVNNGYCDTLGPEAYKKLVLITRNRIIS